MKNGDGVVRWATASLVPTGAWGRRLLAAVLAPVVVASLLSSCGRFAADSSGCGAPTAVISPSRALPEPPAADEALWVGRGSGELRAIDARTNQVTATVDLGQSTLNIPPALAAGDGLVWAYRYDAGDLMLIEPTTARITRHVPIPAARPLADNRLQYSLGATWVVQPGLLWKITTSGAAESFDLPDSFPPQAMAATAHWLWLTDGNRLLRIDPANPASSRRTVPSDVEQLSANAGGLFATAAHGQVIRRLDPETGEVLSSVPVGARESAALVDGGSQFWATSNGCNLLHITNWQSPQLVTTRVSDVSQDLPTAVAFGSLWVGDEVNSRIVRVDLESGQVLARIPFVAADPDDPAFRIVAGNASLWIVDSNLADGISRVDPRTNRVVRLIPASHATSGLSAVVAQAPGKNPA